MADGSLLEGHGQTCPEGDIFRAAWGCDHDLEDIRMSRWLTRCSKCRGDGCNAPGCFGGVQKMPRCPLFYLSRARVERRVFQAFALLKNYNTWPAVGGLLAQSNWFIEAVCHIGNCMNELERKRIEEARSGRQKGGG